MKELYYSEWMSEELGLIWFYVGYDGKRWFCIDGDQNVFDWVMRPGKEFFESCVRLV